ncbi:antibiotic biosynthesis monooxygenase [Sulfodiicoccus acidiphilus]|uniref:Antibiotic biosynthesis monooxygenase n=1 Tax=Sulfodiicoccus acidiphilus TaxID=1670455 RepID=A0A348B1Z7_9CREN|nr:antibiotic biosynthesis monooxygenase [Sulfodiicoccus acidiphilus]BBD72199.1 antibiotic biosynthesis monooxygenase [Sulfodiicoccus acidiphilus]GGT94284.1 antibiotic biosynthesis monooxygenase [Sulfodiicoccus acidiphilus]
MINVGFNYLVSEGKEEQFLLKFREVLQLLKTSNSGMLDAKLYRSVDNPREFLIFTEWESLDAFRKFTSSREYKETVEYGKSVIEGRPRHIVLQRVED